MTSLARVACSAVLAAIVMACAAGGVSDAEHADRARERAAYKPGASIDAARSCSCRECFDRACCSGETEDETASSEELGMTVATCGRCTRRVWTVYGDQSCSERAPAECCPRSVID